MRSSWSRICPSMRGLDLRRELTILIAKLTAILRLANSMDRSHRQKLSDSRIAVRNGSLVITTDCPESIVLEQYSFDQKADFFEEVFGYGLYSGRKEGYKDVGCSVEIRRT